MTGGGEKNRWRKELEEKKNRDKKWKKERYKKGTERKEDN